MRVVNILGCILFFWPIFFNFNSYRALIVMINGILFHSNETNQYFRFWDITCNVIMCAYTYYIYRMAIYYILFSFSCFFINMFCLQKNVYTLLMADVFHVSFVQFPLSVCLLLSLKSN